jgi:carbon storage regulator
VLVLTRKPGEPILIGDDIVITVLDIRGDGVRIGIDAPRGITIQRAEVVAAIAEANRAAASVGDDAEAILRAQLGLSTRADQGASDRSGPDERRRPLVVGVDAGADPGLEVVDAAE